MRYFFRAKRTLKLKHQPPELTQGRLYVAVGECVELELTDDEARTLVEPPVSAVTPITEVEYQDYLTVQAARVERKAKRAALIAKRKAGHTTSSVAARRAMDEAVDWGHGSDFTVVSEVDMEPPAKPKRGKAASVEADESDMEGQPETGESSASGDAEGTE